MNRMREFLRTLLPDTEEVISYGMPAFKQKKVLVFYEAFSKHLGFYPTAGPIHAFEADLKASGFGLQQRGGAAPIRRGLA